MTWIKTQDDDLLNVDTGVFIRTLYRNGVYIIIRRNVDTSHAGRYTELIYDSDFIISEHNEADDAKRTMEKLAFFLKAKEIV